MKDVESRVFTRMLWTDRKTRVALQYPLRNLVGEGISHTGFVSVRAFKIVLTDFFYLLPFSRYKGP